jgi:hypothetical protein
MSEEERRAILEKLQQTTAEAKKLTQEEARQKLVAEGFTDQSGKLSTDYGGQAHTVR